MGEMDMSHYIRDQDWRTYKPPVDSSWSWKKVCKVKDIFLQAYNGDEWDKHPSKKYTMKSGYHWLCEENATVHWSKWAWNGFNIPKHNFICWMVGLNKLQTKSKLILWSVSQDDRCPVCAGVLKQEITCYLNATSVCLAYCSGNKKWG